MKKANETPTPETDNATGAESATNTTTATEKVFEPSAGENRAFTVSTEGGEITTCYRSIVFQDCVGDIFTKETVEEMLQNGEVIFSDEFYYSLDRAKLLAKVEGSFVADELAEDPNNDNSDAGDDAEVVQDAADDEPDVQPDTGSTDNPAVPTDDQPVQPITNGDLVVHIKKGTFAIYSKHPDTGAETVEISEGSTGPAKVKAFKAKDWRRATDQEFWDQTTKQNLDQKPETALAVTPPVLEGEIITGEPLTDKERKQLAKLEAEYETVDGVERQIPFQKGRILNAIRQGKLYRETHNTFGEYAFAKFGITREYAQNLAQIADLPELASEALEAGVEVNMSVNAANSLMRDSNKIARSLGVGKVEFEAMAPIFRNTIAAMASVAPKDAQGNPEFTPRFVNAFNEVLVAHITDGVVDIDGEQMTIKAAQEKGLLNHSLRSEVIQAAAEGIKTQEQVIRSDWERRSQVTNTPVLNGNAPVNPNVKYYKGKVPVLDIECSVHGDTEIMSIAVGKIQTRCGCRFHIDADKGELVAFECNELPIKR